MICGASRLQAIYKVTFPGIRPGMIAGALFAFLVSWDEVVLSVMMASPNLQTLPVKLWTTLRQDLTPVIAVASTLLIGLSVVVMAIARALVYEPRILLMDEPLGALDKKLREDLQDELRQLHRRLGITIVYVTHDQEEAMRLSQRIAIFSHGKIVGLSSSKLQASSKSGPRD